MPWSLAQINIAHMQGTSLEDPQMMDFTAGINRMNALAETSPGFIWRLETAPEASVPKPWRNPRLLTNLSVWQDVKALETFTYHSAHAGFVRRRKEWFEKTAGPHNALWWVESGVRPTLSDAYARLHYLKKFGPTPWAFPFSQVFGPPDPEDTPAELHPSNLKNHLP